MANNEPTLFISNMLPTIEKHDNLKEARNRRRPPTGHRRLTSDASNLSNMSNLTSPSIESAKKELEKKMHMRKASLTAPEAFFLHALLVDDPDLCVSPLKTPTRGDSEENHEPNPVPVPTETLEKASEHRLQTLQKAAKRLDDDILFTVPPELPDRDKRPARANRPSNLGLWKAHEDGVHPKNLSLRGSVGSGGKGKPPLFPRYTPKAEGMSRERLYSTGKFSVGSFQESFASDVEVRREKKDTDDPSVASSWNDSEHTDHYDAWEILDDEYAEDFGFSYTPKPGCYDFDDDDDELRQNTFKILGTSADDKSTQPHVLSPPLMDAIMTFLPEHLQSSNYWLRFSLVRDGASLDTLKRYVRASKYTVLAIETPKGEVFGSFTSSSWRNNYGFYGGIPAFVWKMRHSRQTKYPLQKIQLCHHDGLAVGGDEDVPNLDQYEDWHDALEAAEKSGFAIALNDDLLRGTTSQSTMFKSPSLVGPGHKSETFEVAGLEVWTLSPCFDVHSAEKLEMTKFFVEESVSRNNSTLPSSGGPSSRSNFSQFSSQDLNQEEFYRRVGDDPESEVRRERWQYMNTMNGTNTPRGFGQAPRFMT